jgi:uncharacterized protein YutD
MDAEIKIINNQIERRPVNEIIEVESSNSDIVFMGIPLIKEGEEQDYVNRVNRLCQNVGTVVLVKASSYFKNLEIGHDKGMVKQDKSDYTDNDIDLVISRKLKTPEISYPDDPETTIHLKKVFDTIKGLNDEAFNNMIVDLFSMNRTVYAEIVNTANRELLVLKEKIEAIQGKEEWRKEISETYRTIFRHILEIVDKHEKEVFPEQKIIIENLIKLYSDKAASLIKDSPDIFLRELRRDELKIKGSDSLDSSLYKIRQLAMMGPFRRTRKQKVRFRRMLALYLDYPFRAELTEVMKNWGMISIQQIIKTQDLANRIFDTYFLLNKMEPQADAAELIDEKISTYSKYREQIDKLNESSLQTFYALILNKTLYLVRQLSKDLMQLRLKSIMKRNEKRSDLSERHAAILKYVPALWLDNQQLLNNSTRLELEFFIFTSKAKDVLQALYLELDQLMKDHYINHLQNIISSSGHSTLIFAESLKELDENINADRFITEWDQKITSAKNELQAFAGEMLDKIQLVDRSVYDNFKASQFNDHKAINLKVKRLTEYILKKDFIEPLEEVSHETIEWFTGEIKETKSLIEKCSAVVELIRNEKTRVGDYPQMTPFTSAFEQQLKEGEKTKLRMLNQLQERINALMDKFSINTIIRRTHFLKKFIR